MKKVFMYTFDSFVHDSRITKEANSLKNIGLEVTIIGHGDLGLKKEESINGINIKRFSYLDRTKTISKLRKLKIYFDFLQKSIRFSKGMDYLHCNDLMTLPIGYFVKKFLNKNAIVIYDAHEFETERNGLSSKQKKIVYFIESFLIKSADRVITVSESIAIEYARIYGIKQPFIILNTPPFQELSSQNLFRNKFAISQSQTIFLYQGSLHKGRGIEFLIETFNEISDSSKVIVFMGFGDLVGFIKEKSETSSNIYFQEAVLPSELLDYTSSADFGISLIEDTCLSYRYCLPNKMFEYLMADIPVLVSNLPEMRAIVENHNVGIVIKKSEKLELLYALDKATKLDKSVIESNIKKVKKLYNWEEQEKVLKKVYGDN